ncbi:MAG: hypothetical protein ACI8QG_001718, partial [Flavobacteriales bacterium]
MFWAFCRNVWVWIHCYISNTKNPQLSGLSLNVADSE